MPDGKMKKTAQGKEETHMTELLKLPVGIENFEEIRRDNFYYVDKTKLIEYLNDRLSTEDKCLAVSHARRFGKSHAAGMIDAYYSLGCDSTELFDGTKISESADYKKYMNKYNVIHLDIASVWDFYKEDLVESIKIISRTGIYYGDFADKED